MAIKTDLTEGRVTPRLIFFALPIVVTSLLQSLYSLVDTVIAGHAIGNAALSGMNNSGQMVMLVTSLSIGFANGANVLLGQYFGAKDEDSRQRASGTIFAFNLVLGAVAAVLLHLLAGPILRAMGAPAFSEAFAYLRICSWGVFFSFGYNALAAILRSVGNSRQPLYFILVSSVIHVGLALWFVNGLGFGVAGTAWATLLSQFLEFLLAVLFVLRHRAYYGFTPKYLLPDWEKLRKLLKLGIPGAMQMSIGGISWLAVTYFINKYDVDVSAANGVAARIKDLSLLTITGLCSGASTMAAQSLGAQMFDRAKKAMKAAVGLSTIAAAAVVILIELFTPFFVSLFTSDPNAARYAVLNLRVEIVSMLFYAWFMGLNTLPTAAGSMVFVMMNTFLNCIPVRIVLVVILERLMGLPGIYLACAVAPLSSVFPGLIYYRRGRWREKKLI